MYISYKNLDVYKTSTEYLANSVKIVSQIPRGHEHIVDQLRRASLSIPLNIAEGSGKNSRNDAARFYSISRGSAMECSAFLDALLIMKLGTSEEIKTADQKLGRIIAMLTKMCI